MLSPTLDDEPANEPVVDLPPVGPSDRSRRRTLIALLVAVALVVGIVGFDALRPAGRPGSPPGGWTLVPHEGLGAWVDAFDWTAELGGADPAVGVEEIDAMAEAGVQTLYLQTSHRRSAADVMEPELLDELIDRAHSHDLHVVAWYLPTFVDPATDLRRLLAAADLKVDGLGVDIESTDLPDPVERNRRLAVLSTDLREALGPEKVVAAITLSSVHVQVVNPEFWPGYPYPQIAADYDVLVPMAYWSLRRGELRSGERYIGENLDRLRATVGDEIPIHAVGGIANDITDADVEGMVRAIEDRGAIGGSLYDWATSTPGQWRILHPLRALRDDPRDT